MAVIGRAHGIGGNVSVKTFTTNASDLITYNPFETDDCDGELNLSLVRESGKGIIVHIQGVDDRTSAEKYNGTKLYVPRSRLPEPEKDSFYHTDLIGLRAVSPDGTIIGKVIAVENFGASDILEIQRDDGLPSELIPFIDAFVPAVSLEAKTITVILEDTEIT